MRQLLVYVGLVLFNALGCSSGKAEVHNLDAALSRTGQGDIVGGGKILDTLLYEDANTTIWLREYVPEDSVIILPPGKRAAALYVFSAEKCLSAIPVDTPDQPYAPVVYPLGNGKVLVLSYVLGDPQAVWSDRYMYRVMVHMVAKDACQEVLNEEFEAIVRREAGTSGFATFLPFLGPDGRMTIVKVLWDLRGPAREATSLSWEATYAWDASRNRFVRSPDGSAHGGTR
jgi:hypothetical protein